MADQDNEGRREARTQEKIGGAGDKFGAAAGPIAGFDAEMAAADDLFALLEASPERDAQDSLSLAAVSVTGGRKGAGRPKGSPNRRNVDVFRLYQEGHGHRSPSYVLSLIGSIDPVELAKLIGKHPNFLAALDKITSAATALLPYELAKRTPDVVQLPESVRPVMVIGQLNVQSTSSDGMMRAGILDGHIIDNDADNSIISDS